MSQIASDAKISSAMSKLGMTAPLPNLDDSQVLKAILVALGNVTGGGGGGGGTVTSVESANTEINVVNPTTTPVLTLGDTFGAKTFTGLVTITQAVENAGIIASTGYSLNGSNAASAVSITGTWNTTGTPTAFKLNITDTASNPASLLMDVQRSGTSLFSVTKAQGINWRSDDPGCVIGKISTFFGDIGLITDGGAAFKVDRCMGVIGDDRFIILEGNNTSIHFGAAEKVVLRWDAAAMLSMGNNHPTTPTAQTFKAHNVTTGTGASLTLAGGTGSVAGGAVALATSATTGAPVARLTAKANGVLNIAGVPTSAAGLVTGDIYSNAGILTVV